MKKVLLFGFCALGVAMAANAQATLERLWLNDGVAGKQVVIREGVGVGGKMYLANSGYNSGAVGCIEVWDATGQVETLMPESNYFYGTNITSDDAGNVIAREGKFPNAFSGDAGVFIYNPVSKEKKSFNIDLAGVGGDYGGLVDARNDQWGHVGGDVLAAEGGYLMYGAPGTGKFNEVKIANGEYVPGGTAGNKDSYWFAAGVDAFAASGIISNYDWMPERIVVNPTSSSSFYSYVYGDHPSVAGLKNWTLEGTYYAPDHNKTIGFTMFKIAGETYIVYGRGSNNADALCVTKARVNNETIDDPASLIVAFTYAEMNAEETDAKYNTCSNYVNSLSSELTDDGNSAIIYQYLAPWYVAAYKFTPSVQSAVESVEVEQNAPATYYNLQGVRVNNPQHGIFIRVSGNEASKIVL